MNVLSVYTLLKQLQIQSKHEGVRYPCNQCEFTATSLSHLNRLKKVKHKGLRYECNQCEYAATSVSHLKRHTDNKHTETDIKPNIFTGN